MDYEYFMHRCLNLAVKGFGNVAPNPMVGCVIVNNERIIGEGYHARFGEAHAEVNAINSVSTENQHLIPSSTLFVNLEPCSHHGKTPPCADLIVSKKIKRVIIGMTDPYPEVSGRGIRILKNAGIEVVLDVLKKECEFLNRRFVTFYTQKRPYIILKWAQSADGYMAPDEPKQLWLTNEASQKLVHQWRSEEQAILVGRKTVEIDNPQLTVRHHPGRNPIRLIIDKNLSLFITHKIFRKAAVTYLYNQLESNNEGHLHFIKLDFGKNILPQIMEHLFKEKIQSLIVEGGAFTLQGFINNGLWDEARVFTTPHKLGSGKKSPAISGTKFSDSSVDDDKLQIVMRRADNH
jgi:diaminohydroxyphosphoribosylaminopyrimidine deaminase/5-amino-6-(5-phosphoribosylamino)uracil reductase